jgi:hypothetical protein
MKATKEKPSKKGPTVKEEKASPATEEKRLSPMAKFWATEYVEGEILDMRAVLR